MPLARIRELQSPGSGPFFGENGWDPPEMPARKHGPDPFALDFAVLLPRELKQASQPVMMARINEPKRKEKIERSPRSSVALDTERRKQPSWRRFRIPGGESFKPCPASRGQSSSFITIVVSVLLTAAVALVFGQIAGHGFINYDDKDYVCDNPPVASGLTVSSGAVWAFTNFHSSNWHPANVAVPHAGLPDLRAGRIRAVTISPVSWCTRQMRSCFSWCCGK